MKYTFFIDRTVEYDRNISVLKTIYYSITICWHSQNTHVSCVQKRVLNFLNFEEKKLQKPDLFDFRVKVPSQTYITSFSKIIELGKYAIGLNQRESLDWLRDEGFSVNRKIVFF